jgi:3-methyl-2-oxobutanoate hydroxymethyltransferase
VDRGFKAVGKTADAAVALLAAVQAYEAAGAFAVEIEVVPVEVATEVSRRVDILLWSMGAGCDVQYLFSEDILGENRGHLPRHAKVYRNFAAEFDRLQQERIAAYREFIADVVSGTYSEPQHVVAMNPDEMAAFLRKIA